MLPALNDISRQQARPTQQTQKRVNHLLNYWSSNPDITIRYYASDMILHIDTDAAYLVMPNAKSRIAGYYYLSTDTTNPPHNGPILVLCKTLQHVVASAAEAETAGIFFNAQTGIIVRIALEELGHPQPPTPLKTDNSTATAYVHKNMKQKKSKSWDMRFHWLRDKEVQQQFRIFWDKGIKNLADYYTKHHSITHHQNMRPQYFQCKFLSKINITKVTDVTPFARVCRSAAPQGGQTPSNYTTGVTNRTVARRLYESNLLQSSHFRSNLDRLRNSLSLIN
jgi:hypothetical protein